MVEPLPRVLLELCKTLKPRGVLFSANPRGNNKEGLSDDRYTCFSIRTRGAITSSRPVS